MAAAVHCEPYDADADRAALLHLAVACQAFAPQVGIEEADAPDCLLLDITGCQPCFGDEATLARRLGEMLAARGFAARLAVADTLGAAWAVAHFAGDRAGRRRSSTLSMHGNRNNSSSNGNGNRSNRSRTSRTNSSSSSSSRREPQSAAPAGAAQSGNALAVCLVPPGATAQALRRLPIEALRLPPETLELLRQLGLEQVGQLEQLPRERLPARFGPQLLRRLDQAAGRVAEPVVPVHAESPLAARWVFESPVAQRAALEAVLEQLLTRLAGTLVERRQGALLLECSFDAWPALPERLIVGLFRPSASVRHLLDLVRLKLEQLVLREPVWSIRLQITATAPLAGRQQELFDQPQQRSRQSLATLLERLSSRLGREQVLAARLLRDAQPEQAYELEPLVGAVAATGLARDTTASRGARTSQRARGSRRAPTSRQAPVSRGRSRARAEGSSPATAIARRGPATAAPRVPSDGEPSPQRLPRPLWLHPRPLPLADCVTGPAGPPLRFRWAGRRLSVVQAWGPERIETGWWRGRQVRRDYYQVETATGGRYWLFRRRDDGRWFMHGRFD